MLESIYFSLSLRTIWEKSWFGVSLPDLGGFRSIGLRDRSAAAGCCVVIIVLVLGGIKVVFGLLSEGSTPKSSSTSISSN